MTPSLLNPVINKHLVQTGEKKMNSTAGRCARGGKAATRGDAGWRGGLRGRPALRSGLWRLCAAPHTFPATSEAGSRKGARVRSEARRPSELRARAVTQRAPLPRPSPTRLPPKREAARAALGETASFSCISFMMQVEYPRSQEKSYYKKLMNYRI